MLFINIRYSAQSVRYIYWYFPVSCLRAYFCNAVARKRRLYDLTFSYLVCNKYRWLKTLHHANFKVYSTVLWVPYNPVLTNKEPECKKMDFRNSIKSVYNSFVWLRMHKISNIFCFKIDLFLIWFPDHWIGFLVSTSN